MEQTMNDKEKIKRFYETWDWFERLCNDTAALLRKIGELLNKEIPNHKFDKGEYYYYKEKKNPRLPNPYLAKFGDEVGIYVLYKNNQAIKNWAPALREYLEENGPQLMILVGSKETLKEWWRNDGYIVNKVESKININNNEFNGSFNNINFKGFFVPLLDFSKEKLEQIAKDKNPSFQIAKDKNPSFKKVLDEVIKEKIIEPVKKLKEESDSTKNR